MSVLKIILLHVIIAAGICAGGCLLCLILQINPHMLELVKAGSIGLAAAELAMVPIIVVRGKTADNVVQGALVSTVVHMLVAAGCGLAVLQMNHPPQAFIYWLCAFYFTSLAGVCRVLLEVVKSAPVPVFSPPMSLRQASET